MKLRSMLCSLLLITLSSACASPKGKGVAGRKHSVTLKACQSATPYLVPLEAWKSELSARQSMDPSANEAQLMADGAFLQAHRIQGGHLTNVTVAYPGYPHIAVFRRDGQVPLMFGPFTPPANVVVCFPGCGVEFSAACGKRTAAPEASR
jgi:hypothetical protein